MANTVNVNWSKLKEMGEKTLNNSKEFEEARNKFQEIISSLDECWGGIDSNNFSVNCSSFLEDLKNDTLYLENLGEYFTGSSNSYNEVVENHAEKFKQINYELDDQNEEIRKMVGV